MRHPMGRQRLDRYPVPRVALAAGDRVRFDEERNAYTVRAVSADGRWAICTKPFPLKQTVLYTVIDFDSAVRGPDNRVFGGGYETDEDCAYAMSQFEAGDYEVSVRHDARLNIRDVRPPKGDS